MSFGMRTIEEMLLMAIYKESHFIFMIYPIWLDCITMGRLVYKISIYVNVFFNLTVVSEFTKGVGSTSI